MKLRELHMKTKNISGMLIVNCKSDQTNWIQDEKKTHFVIGIHKSREIMDICAWEV